MLYEPVTKPLAKLQPLWPVKSMCLHDIPGVNGANHSIARDPQKSIVVTPVRAGLRVIPDARQTFRRQGIGRPKIHDGLDRKSTRLNSSHLGISYAVFCL